MDKWSYKSQLIHWNVQHNQYNEIFIITLYIKWEMKKQNALKKFGFEISQHISSYLSPTLINDNIPIPSSEWTEAILPCDLFVRISNKQKQFFFHTQFQVTPRIGFFFWMKKRLRTEIVEHSMPMPNIQ